MVLGSPIGGTGVITIGALLGMAAVAAAVAGWRAIYMLPGLPTRDIVATVTKNPARRPGL